MYCRSITGNEEKIKFIAFKIALPKSLMRAGKPTSAKRGRLSLSDAERQR